MKPCRNYKRTVLNVVCEALRWESECFFGAFLYALEAEDTIGAVLAFAGIIGYVDVHWAYAFALSAGYAFGGIAFHSYKGKVAHRLHKDCDRANVLTEGSVILEHKGENNSGRIVENVSDYKCPKHYFFYISDVGEEKCADENKRCGENYVPYESQLLSRLLWRFIRKKIKHHGSPAGVSAPASAENERTKDLGDCIMNGCRFENACEEVIPEAFDLHIFITDEA